MTNAPQTKRFSLAYRSAIALALSVALAGGCAKFKASNERNWSPDQSVLASAEFSKDLNQVTVRNVRYCDYKTSDDYVVRHYDKTYDLTKLKTVDFVRVPFPDMPELAHTMLSFGFDDKDYVGVSVEIRKEQGETYNPALAAMNKYELMYVVGDERDLIGLRTNFRLNDVYVYATRAEPDQVRKLFENILLRVNKLKRQPEFYNTLTNNCTTNIAKHINELMPNRVPYDYRILLPGYSDRLAYDLGLLKTEYSFDETRRAARVTDVAYRHRDDPEFSQAIRKR
ncbi:MAG: DUF4105 domain-containing protein [Planctomycetia bacterium]|nr:DUF4105 domain-containing protein [Planctomycetia bacterium]